MAGTSSAAGRSRRSIRNGRSCTRTKVSDNVSLARKEARLLRLVGILVVSFTAACDTVPAIPVAPTHVPTVLTSLTISGVPLSGKVGDSVQLAASTVMPDGSTKAVGDVAWKFSDASVATVSATGLLTIVGPGDGEVTAGVENVLAAVRLSVPNSS